MCKFLIFLAFLTSGVLIEHAVMGGRVLDSHSGEFTGLVLAGSFFTIAFAAVVHK
jgi:hypothetical protein